VADFSSLLLPNSDPQASQPQGGTNFFTGVMAQPASNLEAASQLLKLNPQEQALYQRHLDNLRGPGGVDNPPTAEEPQGSRSSLYASVQKGPGNKFYTVPTVWDGKRETQPYTRPSDGKVFDVPNDTAMANIEKAGWDKFPSYATGEEADARYQTMHHFMDGDTGQYLAARKQ
jgi:hypothetical protein